MKEFLLAVFSILFSVLIVFVLVGFGWFIVWKAFLSRFRFVRELSGGMSENNSNNEQKNGRGKIKKVRRD